jgi:hypothetical protein
MVVPPPQSQETGRAAVPAEESDMLKHILYLYGFNVQFAKMLVADVTP